MKRTFIQKAGTIFLTTATGFCILSGENAFGQTPSGSGNELQRRLTQMYAREGKSIPGQHPQVQPKAPIPQDGTAARTARPVVNPAVPNGITAPVSGPLPLVTSAPKSETQPAPFPKTERWPGAELAPPVPAITPGPTVHPLVSTSAPLPPVEQLSPSHPIASASTELEKDAKAALPESTHPIASAPSVDESSFQMPVAVAPPVTEGAPKSETVLTPPITSFDAAEQSQVELLNEPGHGDPVATLAPTPAPLAPPAVPHAESPFADLPKETEHSQAALGPESAFEAPFPQPGTNFEIPTAGANSASSESAAAKVEASKPVVAKAVALSGFCPVTLRDQRTQVRGSSNYASQWQGANYHFVSADAKQKFDANPERYAPAHKGLDITLTTHEGHDIPGSLEHAVWYQRQLYLFRDGEGLKTFTANPAKFVK